MSLFDSDEVQRAVRAIEDAGANVPKEQWVELCEEVSSHFDMSAEAAKEELRRDGGE